MCSASTDPTGMGVTRTGTQLLTVYTLVLSGRGTQGPCFLFARFHIACEVSEGHVRSWVGPWGTLNWILMWEDGLRGGWVEMRVPWSLFSKHILRSTFADEDSWTGFCSWVHLVRGPVRDNPLIGESPLRTEVSPLYVRVNPRTLHSLLFTWCALC